MQTLKNKTFPLINSIIRLPLRVGVILAIIMTSFLVQKQPAYAATNSGNNASVLSSPGPFNKSRPANAANNQPTNPTLSWGTSGSATSYQYCVNTTATSCTTWSNTVSTSVTLSGLIHGTKYYWQVRARNNTGITYANGSSTAWWSYTIAPASAPTKTSLPPTPTPTITPVPTQGQGGNTYYVATNGNDANPGTQDLPWKTIQKCLDWVQPGNTCQILGGTYYESLTLKNSGIQTARITITNYNNQTVTVDSGSDNTLITGGRIHFYTIDGLRFISNTTNAYSIDFGENIWDGKTNKDGGNNGFILRNCYIEGSLRFYGHNILVENCELNGKGVFVDGLQDRFAPSHDNTYKNNVIHDYRNRGIWSMQYTDNIVIEGNTVYDVSNGIDCDGAANNQTRCHVRNNIIHDASGEGTGILFENCFDCTAEGNTIYNVNKGIGIINYGIYPEGYSTEDGREYRNTDTHTIIRNNLIYNTAIDGINCAGSPGGTAINNTIYNSNQTRDYFGGIGLSPHGGYYCHNWTIKNNIISQSKASALFFESGTSGLTNIISDYNFFDTGVSERKFALKRDGTDTRFTFSQWMAMDTDIHSIMANPLFVNAAAGDFHLQPNSPACTAGENGTYIGAFPCQ